MYGDYYKPGDWNAICDVCGFRFKASELTKNWKGEYVCKPDWEPRHPQTYIRVPHEDISVPWTRPEGIDQFIPIACWVWDQSAYADLGTADCMKADNAALSYLTLLEMKGTS